MTEPPDTSRSATLIEYETVAQQLATIARLSASEFHALAVLIAMVYDRLTVSRG